MLPAAALLSAAMLSSVEVSVPATALSSGHRAGSVLYVDVEKSDDV